MIKTFCVCIVMSFAFSLLYGFIFIPILKKLKVGQPVLKYVTEHKGKSGTPTMGGLFFISSALTVFVIFGCYDGKIALLSAVICASYMCVGFIDDFLKVKFSKNEGLKAYQKILFQSGIALVAAVYAYKNGLTLCFLPFTKKTVNLGAYTIPLVFFIFLATTNSVNLTDGLDGLAGSSSFVYLLFLNLLIICEMQTNGYVYIIPEEYEKLVLLNCCVIGAVLGFLLFNAYPAKIFMGDTGSLALGGIIASSSIFSLNSLYIPVIGFVFVFSSISVIIQVINFKRRKKRIFLMTPFHHHLQLKGLSEVRITYIYSLVTGIMGLVCVIFYL